MIHSQNRRQREETLERTIRAFVEFCRIEFDFELYDYQIRVARACFSSLFVEPKDVFIKISRQSGKTEAITLLLRFLIIFYALLVGQPLMAAFASPKGEQAKTDVDRIKKSVQKLRERWQVEDREFNAATVRAYRFDKLTAEIFKFSLAPTTSNESKTLNLLVVEEAHKADDQKRSDELDPMLASTAGVTWMIGVGCTRICDFKRGCDGELPDSVAIIVPVDEVIRDRRKKFEETGNPAHLNYQKAFERELRRKGRENPEIKRNFYLEDMVEEGNFVSRDRLLSCARGKGVIVPADSVYLGGDWARVSDHTWFTAVNQFNDVLRWIKIPHLPYEQQIELLLAELRKPWEDGKPLFDRVVAVRGDSTGQGDMPMEFLQMHSGLPIAAESHVKFTLQSKNDLYVNFENAIFRDEGDQMRFSYPADDPLASEFEEQTVRLVREYKGDGEYLSVHHPDEPDARDDAPDSTALALFGASGCGIGEILFA